MTPTLSCDKVHGCPHFLPSSLLFGFCPVWLVWKSERQLSEGRLEFWWILLLPAWLLLCAPVPPGLGHAWAGRTEIRRARWTCLRELCAANETGS